MHNSVVRAIAGLFLLLVSACQTVPPPTGGFTARQVAALQAGGFSQVDDHWELGIGDRILFATDESALLERQRERLSGLARALRSVGSAGARVEGNTDSTGEPEYNRRLSQRRAEAVKDALISGGMAGDAVRAVGRGQTNPAASNVTPLGRQENRRVVIIISAIDADQS